MTAGIILSMVKVDPKTTVSVLIVNIRNQFNFTPSYCKALIEKHKALEKMHSRWDALYNEVWQWCWVLDRYEIVKGRLHEMLKMLQSTNEMEAQYLSNIPFDKWTQSYDRVCHSREDLWFWVMEFDRPNQGIAKGVYCVHLRNKTCDCGRFDALRFPCAHAITACSNLHLDPMSFVDDVYKLEYLYNVWRHVFPPLLDELMWSPISSALFKLLPDRIFRRKPKGRPMLT
ncbi:hypothetical protein PVK06_035340 [Gossypium arboreum]|uniref:SWIM-type domain-containing protein n=1 Tax=Gossypium arboreum TaxID=29729 RepID=A0ABR0NJL7_GOSAR|nr:hypothetical protein PVK06_035340 [Gossypium arboreum]